MTLTKTTTSGPKRARLILKSASLALCTLESWNRWNLLQKHDTLLNLGQLNLVSSRLALDNCVGELLRVLLRVTLLDGAGVNLIPNHHTCHRVEPKTWVS